MTKTIPGTRVMMNKKKKMTAALPNEQQKIVGEIGIEITGIDIQKICLISPHHKTKILQPFRYINAHQPDKGRNERQSKQKLEKLPLESQFDSEARDRPPGKSTVSELAVPVGIPLLLDGHQSTPTTLAKRSSSEVWLFTKCLIWTCSSAAMRKIS
jgi:hypothetical protein